MVRRLDGVRARSGCSLGWEGKLTIVSTSMVASTTHTATSILTSVERPEATSMVSMVSIVPPTQLFCRLYVAQLGLPRLRKWEKIQFGVP